MAAEIGGFRRCVGHHFGDDGPVAASMDACEKQGCSETELGDSIAVSFGDSLDHAVQAEAAGRKSFCLGRMV
jgi:hypothetical protein